ncbi:MAG TPA: CDP-alcohol phosphatidyltransferase family protein [Gemmatimonadaceae bacterium]|nr:CDP-alcohol phosphatidyltransferase family protein [Gemmatimonadaceae bacterium]
MARDSLATLPNLISLSRVGLAAAFAVLKDGEVRLLLIAAAGITDYLDGYFARTRGVVSRWGALVDPIADRLFILIAVSALLFDGVLATWQYAVLISRDFMTAVGFLTARVVPWLRSATFKSRFAGKVVTVMQLATLALVFIVPRWLDPVVVLVGIVSAYSIGDYTWALWRARARA